MVPLELHDLILEFLVFLVELVSLLKVVKFLGLDSFLLLFHIFELQVVHFALKIVFLLLTIL